MNKYIKRTNRKNRRLPINNLLYDALTRNRVIFSPFNISSASSNIFPR